MGIAVLSLSGLFIALYMYLYKIGKIGTLACGTGSCETVQLSPQAWPSRLLAFLAGGAVLFTAYLTYLELFVIHAICRWCVASAAIILLTFGLSLWDLRRTPEPG
jgi:uncharacterized membrane protein